LFISVEDSVLVGVVASIVLFVPRAARLVIRELIVTPERVLRVRMPGEPRDPSLLIFDLEGELFFGAASQLHQCLSEILEEASLTGARFIVLRLRRSRHPDVVAIEQLDQFLRDARQAGNTVLLAGLSPEFVKIMENVGLTRRIEADRVFPEDEREYSATLRAVRHAYVMIRAQSRGTLAEDAVAQEPETPVYYLV
jgi:SulP family sulfate permease